MVLSTLFFPVNFTWLLRKWICRRFLIKPKGGKHNSISFHFCKLRQQVFFFYFNKAYILELQKSFLLVMFFNQISCTVCNKGLNAKISCYFLCFFCFTTPLPPLTLPSLSPPSSPRLESSSSRKTTALLTTSHRLKKYKNLHPRSFMNGAKTW